MMQKKAPVEIEKTETYTIIKIRPQYKLRDTATVIQRVMASIANGQETDALLDIGALAIMTTADKTLIETLDSIATQLNINMSLINPKPGVKNYIMNSGLNQKVSLFETMYDYAQSRQFRYFDV